MGSVTRDNHHILHLSRTMGQGGAEKIVLQLACAAAAEGHRVMVASAGGSLVPELAKQGVTHETILDPENRHPAAIVHNLRSLTRIIREGDIQLLHTHHRMAALYGRLLKLRFPHLRLIYTAHNVFSDKRQLTRFALGGAAIVAVGEAVAENMTGFFALPKHRVRVIYNAVAPEQIPAGTPSPELEALRRAGKLPIGLIGRLTEQKGCDVFLSALAVVRKTLPRVQGVFIGDGPLMAQLQQRCKAEKLTDCVTFLGYQPRVSALIPQLELVCMPSRYEGFPLVPMEAFRAGRTIIASDIPGIRELVRHGENGLLVPAEDVEALATAIEELLCKPDFRRTLEENASLSARSPQEYDRFLQGYREEYQKLLSS